MQSVLSHGDYLCRADKRKNDEGIKWWCYKCNRYVKEDGKHTMIILQEPRLEPKKQRVILIVEGL
jgi:hypothetical protein